MDDGCYLTHVFAQVQMGGNSGMAKCRIVNALAAIVVGLRHIYFQRFLLSFTHSYGFPAKKVLC